MKNIVGNIYSGVIVHKEQNSYLVDIGIGVDAILNNNEATRELEVNDVVDVIVAYYVKDEYYVSMKGVERKKHLEEINELINSDKTIKGRVVSFKNNRFIVDIGNGIKGSVYVKNMDTKFIDKGDEYLNKDYDFKVVEKSRRGYEDYELNRRDLVAVQQKELKSDFLEKYHVGDKVIGKVQEINNAGLILDVNSIHCFVPRSEIAHYNLKEMPEVGSEFEVLIKEVQERSLSLKGSIKELQEHPFAQAEKLEVGTILKGKISRIVDYGIFVEIFDHLDGLVHISEISYEHTKNMDGFEVGQEIEVKVINVDKDKKKIGLSIKRLKPSAYQTLREKVNVGDTISVLIKRITENGIRVMVMDDFYTTIINEDIHDFSKVKPTLRINDRLEVIVMEVDDENEKLSLSNEEFVKKEYEYLASNI